MKTYTKEYKENIIKEYFEEKNKTGTSVAEFAKKNNICKSTFFTWIRKEREKSNNFKDITKDIIKYNNSYNQSNKIKLYYNDLTIEFNENLLDKIMGIVKTW